MFYFKWLRAFIFIGFLFTTTPNAFAIDTTNASLTNAYAITVADFSLQNFAFHDHYLGGDLTIHWWDAIEHGFEDIGHGIEDLGNDIKNGVEDLGNDIKSGFTTAWNKVSGAIKEAAEVTGDALETAGKVTGDYIKDHPAMFGMLAASLVLTAVTLGAMGPVLGEVVADDVVLTVVEESIEAATEAGTEAGTTVTTEVTEETVEEAASTAESEATTASEDTDAAMDTGATKVEQWAGKIQSVYGWYMRQVTAEGIVKSIEDHNPLAALKGIAALEQSTQGVSDQQQLQLMEQLSQLKIVLQTQPSSSGDTNNAAILLQAKSLAANITEQEKMATTAFTKTINQENVTAETNLINSAGLSTAQQKTLVQWATQNNSAGDVTFLQGALQFVKLYNAAQGVNNIPASILIQEEIYGGYSNDQLQQEQQNIQYQQFIAGLSPNTVSSMMAFVASNNLVPASQITNLNNTSYFLAHPYEYFMAQEEQGEQNNLAAIKNSSPTANVTITTSSSFAIQQMIQQLQGLPTPLQQSVMDKFYGMAYSTGDTATIAAVKPYILANGYIPNSNVLSQATLSAQTILTNAQNNINTSSNQITAAQNSQNNYSYALYANSQNVQVYSLFESSPTTSSTVQISKQTVRAQLAAGGFNSQAQANVNNSLNYMDDPPMVSVIGQTVNFAQLYNAAYASNSTSATAQQAFASYLNTLSPKTSLAMMAYAVQEGLVSQQNALLLTDPTQYLQNQITQATQNNNKLSALLPLVPFGQSGSSTAFSQLPIQFIVDPHQYAMAQLYEATKGWNQSQLQTLAARVYYGAIINGTGMDSLVQNYLTPTGSYQNNPQNIMSQQEQSALRTSVVTPQMSPAALTEALQNLPQDQAQSWINEYKNSNLMQNMMIDNDNPPEGGPFGVKMPSNGGNLYDSAITQYQQSLSSTSDNFVNKNGLTPPELQGEELSLPSAPHNKDSSPNNTPLDKSLDFE